MDVFSSDKTTNQFAGMFNELQSGIATTLIGKYTLSDNSIIWLNEIYAPVIDANNKTVKILILATNITQQKELEEIKSNLLTESNQLSEELLKKQKELEENALKFSTGAGELDQTSAEKIKTIEALNSTLPFVETDLDFNIVSVNKKFSEMFKYHERELLNKHLSRILPIKEKEVLSIPYTDFKEGEAIEFQVKIQSRDRQIFPVSMNLIPFNLDKRGLEKIVIYISGGDFGVSPENGLKGIGDELEMKKIELKQITEKIERMKSEKSPLENRSSDDSDELYNKWLTSLKAEHGKK
jgi:PAS domain S-box-containing protein